MYIIESRVQFPALHLHIFKSLLDTLCREYLQIHPEFPYLNDNILYAFPYIKQKSKPTNDAILLLSFQSPYNRYETHRHVISSYISLTKNLNNFHNHIKFINLQKKCSIIYIHEQIDRTVYLNTYSCVQNVWEKSLGFQFI